MSDSTLERLGHALERAGAPWEPPAAHGLISGWLAGGGAPSGEQVARELLGRPETAGDPALRRLAEDLEAVVEATHQGLGDALMGFAPWLPADDAPLAERARAMAEWAEGFGLGFALGTRGLSAPLTPEVQEVLRDLAELARASTASEDDEESEEAAFAELYEYLRMAVLMLREEVRALRRPAS